MRIGVKHKRGIRIRTRFIVSALLLLIQFAFLFAFVYRLSESIRWMYIISEVIAVVLVIYLVNRRGNPGYKIMWIIFILIFPTFGISVFLLWGGGRVMPHLQRRMRRCEEHYLSLLSQDEAIHEKLRYHDFLHARQADFLSRESGYPLYADTESEYLSPGEIFLPRFLEELGKAKKYIFMEFFIIAEGEMWNAVDAVLQEKIRQGVEVRILFDDFGSINRQHKDFITRLRRSGIMVSAFNRVGPSMNIFQNNRNHRKIVVIDGEVAFTGGLNLADEYINRFERFGYWMDCAVLLRGRAVESFLVMFCAMWEFTTGEQIDMASHLTDRTFPASNRFVLPYCDDPLDQRNPAEGIYMQIINTAQRYVYITTPYLIVDSEMISLLRIAAKSGIDVRIITPHIGDKWYVHPVTQYTYLELLEAGVRIYEYTPGFIHSKLFLSDDRVATVGTVNMDYRSFLLHFECGAWICDSDTVAQIKTHFGEILDQSEEITQEVWRKTPWYIRLKRALLHLFAPLM